jgi:hypothetical protein
MGWKGATPRLVLAELGHSQIQNRPLTKTPPDGDQRAGPVRMNLVLLERTPNRRLHPIRGEQSPGLKFNVSCRARHSAQIAPKTASA